MSSHEGDDHTEHPRTETSDGLESDPGRTPECRRSSTLGSALSMRQVQRMLAAYRKEGAAAVVHGNRDRKPEHTIGDEVRKQVIAASPNDLPGLQSTASTRLAGRTRGDQALAGQCASHPASGRIADRAEATQAAASTSTQAIRAI